LLRVRRRTYAIALASVFAALYATLGVIPVSRFVLGSGFLTASKIVAPLAGMLFGPLTGGFAALLGDVIDFAYAGQFSSGVVRFDTLAADLAVVATAGLAFTLRRRAAVALAVALLVLYSLDPLSVNFVGPVPFAWLHIVSVIILAGVLTAEQRGWLGRLNPAFVAAVTLAALMAGHLAGTIVGQSFFVRVYGSYTIGTWRNLMATFVFPLYPVERIFYTVAGTLVAVPVLRAVSRSRRNSPRVS